MIQSLMGRRQFLIATGLASTCALNNKKLLNVAGLDTQVDPAMASEMPGTAGRKENANNRYKHLLSPIQIADTGAEGMTAERVTRTEGNCLKVD